MTVTNVLVKSALDYLYSEYPDFLFYVQRTDLETTLQNALDNALPSDFTLQSDKPDFEAIILQMVQQLQTDPVWLDIIPTGTGQTLLRNMSAGIAQLHFAIMRGTQITFLKPGTPKSSVYAIMQNFGVNPRRKIPARIDVQITIPEHIGEFVIPKFTQFTIQNQNFFNRTDIVYTQFDLYKNITLYQGSLFTQSGLAAGNAYETVEIGYDNYAISNEDVYVSINDEDWTQATTAVWLVEKKLKQFFVRTLDTGNIEIMFGNDAYAKKLNPSDLVTITWFETLGASVVDIPTGTSFNTILSSGANSGVALTCTTLGNVYGSDDELPLDYYTNNGPFIRSAEHGAVTRTQYPIVATRYPRVKDALFRGQAELNPGKRNWMNIVQATVLTSDATVMTTAQWNDFVAYMIANSIAQIEITRRDPFIIPIDISATVYCSNQSILDSVKALLTSQTLAISTPRRGSIGYSVYQSDAENVLKGNFDQTSIKNLNKIIEYIDNFKFTYTAGFDITTLPTGAGIDLTKDGVIADFYSYIAIRNVNLTCVYTPRRSFSGRRDMNLGATS